MDRLWCFFLIIIRPFKNTKIRINPYYDFYMLIKKKTLQRLYKYYSLFQYFLPISSFYLTFFKMFPKGKQLKFLAILTIAIAATVGNSTKLNMK